jgi:antitoxin (DNA-binding transcriptional repressor) of toxin-antitoxin stability system
MVTWRKGMAATELTVTISTFKANCLDLVRKLESGKLKRITLTRRGKPVAEVSAKRPEKKKTFADIYGCMRGTITIAPGVDLTEPVFDPDDWNAERGILLDDEQ